MSTPKTKRGGAPGETPCRSPCLTLLEQIQQQLEVSNVEIQRTAIRKRMRRMMRGWVYRCRAVARAAEGADPESALPMLELHILESHTEVLRLAAGLSRDRARATETPVPILKH